MQDERSRQIVQKMKEDEAQHRASAEQAGGVPLSAPVKTAMRAMSKVMTSTAYWI
ncbi:2-nonaprenyl-3-methyl-6-methoxy-1,4-benzoquinol hydroxylase [compost metagenome]